MFLGEILIFANKLVFKRDICDFVVALFRVSVLCISHSHLLEFYFFFSLIVSYLQTSALTFANS